MSEHVTPSNSDQTTTTELLRQLVGQVERLNERLDKLEALQQAAESVAAVAVDMVDEQAQQLSRTSTPANQRLAGLLELSEHLTRQSTLEALSKLVDRTPQLEQLATLADTAPDALAALMDVVDEWAARQAANGMNLSETLSHGLRAAMWLAERVREGDLERLGMLLQSDVVDPKALQVVGNAASALVDCQREACHASQPRRAGLFALLGALRNPDTQQSLAFALRFAEKFGSLAGKPCRENSTNQEPTV